MPPTDFDSLASRAFDSIKGAIGKDALYKPKAGGIIPIRGVFDDRAQEVDPDTERVVSSNIYSFGINEQDLPAEPQKGDQVVIDEITYKVIDSQEDGVPGVSTVLILHKVT